MAEQISPSEYKSISEGKVRHETRDKISMTSPWGMFRKVGKISTNSLYAKEFMEPN